MPSRLAGLIAAAVMLLPLGATAAEKPKVITTFTVIADIARNVAGDRAEVDSITKPGAEIHNYQPTPRDILKARDADLVLWNGLNLERWFEKFLANLGTVPAAVISDGVQPISISGGGYDGKPNPHAWMSPDNALIYVENIRKALAQVDPQNSEAYAANAKAYSDKIRAEIEPMKAKIAALPAEKRWPVNADAQGTPQQVRAVIDAMREYQVHVIFSESTISDKPARQVAEETGAAYGGVLYVDSLSEDGGPVPTYLDLLKVTVSTIAEGLAS